MIQKKIYKVLLLGRKNLAVECLTKMEQEYPEQFRVMAVSSNPNTRVWWSTNWLAQYAWERGIVFVPDTQKNDDLLYSIVQSFGINLIISVQYRWVLSERILDAVEENAFNLHAAKLPDYKGYNSVNHALLNDEERYAVTIHRMTKDVDAGGILFEESFPIVDGDTAKSVYAKSMTSSKTALFRLIDALAAGKLPEEKKIEGAGQFYAKKDIEDLREVTDEDEIIQKARAFYFPPFEPAYYSRDGQKVYLIPEKELSWQIQK